MNARHVQRLAALALGALLAGCATGLPYGLQPGASAEEVVQRLGRPGAEVPLPGGGRRLEFASGPFGRTTYMVELDAQGRLLRWENVLDEAHFNDIVAGLTREQVRERLGPPSVIWGVRYHDQTVWSYRSEGRRCELFHVGITPQGVVEDTSYGPDPLCERGGLLHEGLH